MIINTKFDVGDIVQVTGKPNTKGTVSHIDATHSTDNTSNCIMYLVFNEITQEYYNYFEADLDKISGPSNPGISLSTALITGLKTREDISRNLVKVIKSSEELDRAFVILKQMMDLEVGETYDSGEVVLNCYEKSTFDFKELPEYVEVMKEVDRIKEYLKLSHKASKKVSHVIAAKLVNK